MYHPFIIIFRFISHYSYVSSIFVKRRTFERNYYMEETAFKMGNEIIYWTLLFNYKIVYYIATKHFKFYYTYMCFAKSMTILKPPRGTLRRLAVHCAALRYISPPCGILRRLAVHCTALRYIAPLCGYTDSQNLFKFVK